MTEWKTYKLGDIADIQTGPFGSQLHNKDYALVGSPIVTVEHLGNRHFTTQNLPLVSDADKARLSKYILSEGDIVFSRVGSVDRCSYVSDKEVGWLFSGRCLRVRCNREVYPLYIYYYFCLESVKQYIRNVAVGATMPSINTQIMSEIPISLPSLEEQRRIAGILGAIDDKIENNRRINTNLELQAQALYKQWFVDNRSDDWEEKPLSEIITIYDSQRKPLSGQQREKMDKVYPYYGAASLMDYVDGYLFDGIYLLLGEDGTVVDELGFPILQYVWGKFWVNNHAHILTGKNGFSTETLYVLLKQTSVKSIVTGAVQPKISQANLKNISVTIPPIYQLSKYNEVIEPLFKTIRKNNDESSRLATLRDTLLPKLMNGEIKL